MTTTNLEPHQNHDQDPEEEFRTWARNNLQLLIGSLEEALASTRDYYITCAKCNRRTPAAFPDMTARTNAAEKILDRLLGKARQAAEPDDVDTPHDEQQRDKLLRDPEARAALRRRLTARASRPGQQEAL